MPAGDRLSAIFRDDSWYAALGLLERVDLIRRRPLPPSAAERGAARLGRWTTKPPLDDPEVLRMRLEAQGLVPEELHAALGARPSELAARTERPPPWLRDLQQAYEAVSDSGREELFEAAADLESERRALLGWLSPLLSAGMERLRARAREIAGAAGDAPFEPRTVAGTFLPHLLPELLEMTERTLALELHVARLQGELAGEGSEDRFRSFVRRLEDPPAAAAVLAEYPVLARRLTETVTSWVRTSAELLERFTRDRRLLEERFVGPAAGLLARVEGALGDRHRDGRAVAALEMESGAKVVYKPRSLAGDVRFQDLLRWLNRRGGHPPYRTLEVADRGSYGWMEFAAAGPCAAAAEVERFYERQGGYLALLYALNAYDFHYQNVLACGEHPVLADLESLFGQEIGVLRHGEVIRAAGFFAYSVVRTGLLPQLSGSVVDGWDPDISGLGGSADQAESFTTVRLEAPGTDRMRMTEQALPFSGGRNRPFLGDRPVAASEWVPAIRRGFESVYRTLVRHRRELLAPGGPLARFADCEVRVLLRSTRVYRTAITDTFHPDLLRDAAVRDLYLDRLWLGVREHEELSIMVPAELEEMDRLDIPVFTARPDGRCLRSGGGRRFEGFFARTGLELARERIAGLDEADLERQSWLVEASLAALERSPAPAPEWGSGPALDGTEPAARERLLAAARRVGDHLIDLAFVGEGGASWVGVMSPDERHFTPRALGYDLYSGVSGVALFLSLLGSVTGDERYAEAAGAAWRTVDYQVGETRRDRQDLGAFTGVAGIGHAAILCGAAGGDAERLGAGRRLLLGLGDLLEGEESADVIAGTAGAVAVLLGAHRATGRPELLELARRGGERLIESGRPQERGIGWRWAGADDRAYAGFAHGAAGIAWALLQLAAATGEDRFRGAALAGLAYERSLYDPERRNWRDLRTFLGPDGGFTVAWCHGAPGIGLARLACLDLLDDPPERRRMLEEAEVAVETTLDRGFAGSHCLCHGALGNLELLVRAARRLERPELTDRTYRLAAVVCREVEAGRYHCGIPGGFETPGLMDGLAGIGYGLLRLAVPERVPSVLLLEPPGRRAEAAGEAWPGRAVTAA